MESPGAHAQPRLVTWFSWRAHQAGGRTSSLMTMMTDDDDDDGPLYLLGFPLFQDSGCRMIVEFAYLVQLVAFLKRTSVMPPDDKGILLV